MRLRRLTALACTGAAIIAAAPAAAHAGTYPVFYANGVGCGMFAASNTQGYSASVCGGAALTINGIVASSGSEENISTAAPPGIAIIDATTGFRASGPGSGGWGSGDFYSGGGVSWNTANSPISDPPFGSGYWGFQLLCSNGGAVCGVAGSPPHADPAQVAVTSITFTASEAQSPTSPPRREACSAKAAGCGTHPGTPGRSARAPMTPRASVASPPGSPART